MKSGTTMQVAALQMVSTPSLEQNIAAAEALIGQAADAGAELLLLPEYWCAMGLQETDKLALAETPGSGPIQDFMRELARRHQIWLVGGTLPLQSAESGKVWNACLVYDAKGEQVARYDKIHLFNFTRGNEHYDEARTISPGAEVVSFEARCGRVGLSVCYDLRFPELYRALGDCALIVVPSAFTWTTGRAHWEVLLRARAIENQCYVLAAAQGGQHPNGRHTWGHSMLIDPWGGIVAQCGEGAAVVQGAVESTVQQQVRTDLPAWRHRRL